jgi:hypothetical protein
MHPLLILLEQVDPVPADKDVTAGYVALAVFVGLALAVVVLGISLTRHLRKVKENAEKGVFGPPATDSKS